MQDYSILQEKVKAVLRNYPDFDLSEGKKVGLINFSTYYLRWISALDSEFALNNSPLFFEFLHVKGHGNSTLYWMG